MRRTLPIWPENGSHQKGGNEAAEKNREPENAPEPLDAHVRQSVCEQHLNWNPAPTQRYVGQFAGSFCLPKCAGNDREIVGHRKPGEDSGQTKEDEEVSNE